jgi:hypothetical protein
MHNMVQVLTNYVWSISHQQPELHKSIKRNEIKALKT